MKQYRLARPLALLLCLALLLPAAAQALTLEQAQELVEQYYIYPIPPATMEEATVPGLINALGDPYTQYFTAEEYIAFMASMGDYDLVGVGVSCTAADEGLLIQRVFADSAAEGAGLVAGDIITAIDGVSLAGLALDLSASYLRGAEGTQVALTVLHADGTRVTKTLMRAHFTVPATDVTIIDDHIALITCDTFGEKTYGQFADAVASYSSATDKWIADLRGNLGGDVQAAADSASVFAGSGDKVYLQDKGDILSTFSTSYNALTIRPAIVLTSPYTASSAEIFATALRVDQSGILIGTRTFGKGVGQILLDETYLPDFFEDGDAMKITATRFHSTYGTTHDQIGLLPNLMISEANTLAVALLLSASAPEGDNSGFLRLHIGGWRWYLDLATAAKDDYYYAFVELLEALSPNMDVYIGDGGQTWRLTDAQALANQYAPEYTPRTLSNVEGDFSNAIQTLATYGIVHGDEHGDFNPDQPLTRAALCALLMQSFGYYLSDVSSPFADVPDDAWYAPYVTALYRMGIVNGYDDGLFHPDDIITQQQFMAIAGRTAADLNLVASGMYRQRDELEVDAAEDYAAYDPWARAHVWLTDGLYYDDAVNIDPHAPALRGQAAFCIYNIMSYFGILCE